ncbi:unnamed protein product [Arctia plantaginis]|uniref:Peptidase S1 domain-containing protein n=1 Tax=Arctia plantaginis TaxID=874455 RepID=A0A8S1BLE4_ARCPL|nr:unnamed protein product [Arctia plantaginis]
MCDVYCKEVKGWCKSFTRIESLLTALEVLLLFVLIGLVTFLILHLIACSSELENLNQETLETGIQASSSSETPDTKSSYVSDADVTAYSSVSTATLSPDIECTWTPSVKTEALTHYYWTPGQKYASDQKIAIESPKFSNVPVDDEIKHNRNSNGHHASQTYKNYVAALIKLKPPEDVTFGCILTKVTQYWTLTAASCIESIEEVESLDSFFITDSYGTTKEGNSHAVVEVRIHPLYQGVNRSYDLAALRSETVLIPSKQLVLRVPTLLEYFVVAVGERFTILGYGGYRSLDRSSTGRRLREVSTYTVSLTQCADEGKDVWSLRHLLRGGELMAGSCGANGEGACGAFSLCAGSMHSRAAPCSYCGGTPLLRDGKLFGIMAKNRHCGVACEPTLYVNVAALKDWLVTVCANKALVVISLVMAAFIVCTIGAAVIQIMAVLEDGNNNDTITLDDFP